MKAMRQGLLLAASLTFFGVAQAGPLTVGAAKVDITSMAYPGGSIPVTEFEHERIYIRAIVLDNGDTRAVLIGADLGGLRYVWEIAAPQVAAELDVPVDNILMSATHTHSSIRGTELWDAEGFAGAMLQAVRAAKSSLQPARVGFGEGASYLNVNRDVIDAETRLWTQDSNLDAPSDKTLAVLAFYDAQGAPIAGYMNYAMHPVNGYLSGILSGDFPGAASRHIEQAFDDKMVMIFSQGATGDQNPLHLRAGTNVMAAVSGVEVTGFELTREVVEGPLRSGQVERRSNDPVADRALKRWMDAQGQVVGEEVIRVMSKMDRLSGEARIGARQMVLTCPGRDLVESVERGSPGTYKDGDDVNIRLGFLGINEIALTAISRDAYTVIGQHVKAKSPLAKTMVVVHANEWTDSGYIVPDDAYGRNTFQVVQSRLKPGCAETGIVENLIAMIYDYIS